MDKMDKENMVYAHNRILPSLKKDNPFTLDSMDKPEGHYAKQNKPDTERQLLHDLTYMWALKRNSGIHNKREW